MDNTNCNTEHKKYQHLTSEERHEIEVRLKDKWSIYKIAKHLGRPYNTIKNEIDRGTVYLYNGKVARYNADKGREVYLEHRQNSRRNYRALEAVDFLKYVEKQFFDEKWSLDACVGHAKANKKFSDKQMVCTKTLYNYVDLGLLNIKNIDLPEKLRRSPKKKRVRENKRKLGNSIEQRPDEIDTREEFGHWEIDSVIGRKNEGEPQVMTIVERKLREAIWIKIRDHSAEAIDEALAAVIDQFGDRYNEVFKSITGDKKKRESLSTLRTHIPHMKREPMNVTTVCCADLFQRERALITTVPTISYTSQIRSTICRERFSGIIHRRSCLRRNSIVYTPPERRSCEFLSLVATLLTQGTHSVLLQI